MVVVPVHSMGNLPIGSSKNVALSVPNPLCTEQVYSPLTLTLRSNAIVSDSPKETKSFKLGGIGDAFHGNVDPMLLPLSSHVMDGSGL